MKENRYKPAMVAKESTRVVVGFQNMRKNRNPKELRICDTNVNPESAQRRVKYIFQAFTISNNIEMSKTYNP